MKPAGPQAGADVNAPTAPALELAEVVCRFVQKPSFFYFSVQNDLLDTAGKDGSVSTALCPAHVAAINGQARPGLDPTGFSLGLGLTADAGIVWGFAAAGLSDESASPTGCQVEALSILHSAGADLLCWRLSGSLMRGCMQMCRVCQELPAHGWCHSAGLCCRLRADRHRGGIEKRSYVIECLSQVNLCRKGRKRVGRRGFMYYSHAFAK